MKYIVFEDNINPPTPVIFPTWLNHSIVARLLEVKDEVTSAGFLTIFESGEVDCYGTSTSLKKSAKREDSDLIRKLLENG